MSHGQIAVEYAAAVAFYVMVCVIVVALLYDQEATLLSRHTAAQRAAEAERLATLLDTSAAFPGVTFSYRASAPITWNGTLGSFDAYLVKSTVSTPYVSVNSSPSSLVIAYGSFRTAP